MGDEAVVGVPMVAESRVGACTWQNVVWSAQWIMDREVVFGAIQSIVLINGDNGVHCCSCFWGSGCGCCRNCFV